MPALVTHAIHSGECLEKIKPELEKRGLEVNGEFADFVGASAISHDTMALLLGTGYYRCFVNAHEKNTDAFFLALIGFIKENGLQGNANAMAYLYGMIMHYALDIEAHPLIYYMTQRHPAKCLVSALDAHLLFESWIDAEKEKELQINPQFPFRKRVGAGGIDALIDAAYETVYGLKKAAAGYKSGVKIWKFYRFHFRSFMLNKVKQYFPDFEEMLNPRGEPFQHPVTGETMSASFRQAYDNAIGRACELILAVNANIFDGADNGDELKQAFGNSYDTGIAWDDPRPKQFFKEYAEN
ncbi:MAG: zinc dependent phospholipase C family protein [Firmicutes bacterium]|nr:zinc dependent phospholipase C family protein [Bacillota bacterium]